MAQSPSAQERTLFMADLAEDWSAQFIKYIFFKCGLQPYRVRRSIDVARNIMKPYCFVEFFTEEEARQAMTQLNGVPIPLAPGKNFSLNFAVQYVKTEYSVYVSNLNHSCDCAGLYGLFSHLTSCRGAQILRDRSGMSKASGIVRFTDIHDFNMALKLDGLISMGKRISLKAAKRDSHYKKRPESLFSYNNSDADFSFLLTPPGDEILGMRFDECFKRESREPLATYWQNVDEENENLINRHFELDDDLESSRWSPFLLHPKVSVREFTDELINSRWKL